MRPVKRGDCTVSFSQYRDAREALEKAIGNYYSYCEWENPATIEHVLPWDKKHTSLRDEWDSLLLACQDCNGNKAKRHDATPYDDPAAARQTYLWPHINNTARAFEYLTNNKVTVSRHIEPSDAPLARQTHHMLGFDDESASSRRWRARKGAWTRATELHANWEKSKSDETRKTILNAAIDHGFFSVWRAVFKDEPEILSELISVFPGTRIECFAP